MGSDDSMCDPTAVLLVDLAKPNDSTCAPPFGSRLTWDPDVLKGTRLFSDRDREGHDPSTGRPPRKSRD